ncbi:Acylphosphatase-2 [Armadillidium nasatum]|uniref:Acylphosphatase-2 n=1 Tax=Armadillidium nasatum TaxID=96803 RepID=A0A5N5TCM7_9CRUS|nr:Acylphosphatase-2 [Armadillidium nasatum]
MYETRENTTHQIFISSSQAEQAQNSLKDNIVLDKIIKNPFFTVAGCNFTKYAKDLAEQNGISGWIKNSRTGSITGRIQGTKESIDHIIFKL